MDFACGLPAGGHPWLAVDGFDPRHRCPGRLLGSASAFEKSPRGNAPLGDEVLVPVGVHCRTPGTGNDRLRDPPKRAAAADAAGSAVLKKERELVILEDAATAGRPQFNEEPTARRPRSASGAGAGEAVSDVDGEAPPREHGRALLRAWGLLPERGTATFLTVALAPEISVREPQK